MVSVLLYLQVRNVEDSIVKTLNYFHPFVNAWIIDDLSSTDKTRQVILKWQKSSLLPGELISRNESEIFLNILCPLSSLYDYHAIDIIKQRSLKWLRKHQLIQKDSIWYLLVMSPYYRFDRIDLLINKWKNQLSKPTYEMNFLENITLYRLPQLWALVGWSNRSQPLLSGEKEMIYDVCILDTRSHAEMQLYYQTKSSIFKHKLLHSETQGILTRLVCDYLKAVWFFGAKDYDQTLKWGTLVLAEWKGKHEEVWHTKYLIAKCYEEQHEWQFSLQLYLDVYDLRPTRIEPLLAIVKHLRKIKQYYAAFLFLSNILDIPYPKNDKLGIEYLGYVCERTEEVSVLGYFIDKFQEGQEACEKLRFHPSLPKCVKIQALNTQKFYSKPITFQTCMSFTSSLVPSMPQRCKWFVYNPSILLLSKEETQNLSFFRDHKFDLVDQCFLVNLRIVNKIKDRHTANNTQFTFNILLLVDSKTYNIIDQHYIYDLRAKYINLTHYGMEDVRLFLWRKQLWASYTALDHRSEDKIYPQIGLGIISQGTKPRLNYYQSAPLLSRRILGCPPLEEVSEGEEILYIDSDLYLEPGIGNSGEKNWLPYVNESNDALYFFYRLLPLQCLEFDLKTGARLRVVHGLENIPSHIPYFYEWRNSAGPVFWGNGYLFLVHEKADNAIYLHRFIWFSQDWKLSQKSFPFHFWGLQIEFVMSCFRQENYLVLGVGRQDNEAFCVKVPCSVITNLLHSI